MTAIIDSRTETKVSALDATVQSAIATFVVLSGVPDMVVVDTITEKAYTSTNRVTLGLAPSKCKRVIVQLTQVHGRRLRWAYGNTDVSIYYREGRLYHEVTGKLADMYIKACNAGCSICARVCSAAFTITDYSTSRSTQLCSTCQKDATQCTVALQCLIPAII